MRLWSGKEKPCEPGHWNRGYRSGLDVDLNKHHFMVTFLGQCVNHENKWLSPYRMTSFGIQWIPKFRWYKDYYDGDWAAYNFGFFFVSLFR